MMKRTLIGTAIITLLIVIFALIFSGSEPAPQHHVTLSTTPKPWNGSAQRAYDAIFVRDGVSIELQNISYTHLDTAATNVTISLLVTADSGPTGWLAPSSFLIRTPSETYYPAHVTLSSQGPEEEVTVVANRLPTADLANTCSTTFAPSQAVGLFIYSPDGLFIIQLIPPPPPAGHCFASPPSVPSSCGQAAFQLKSLSEQDAARSEAIAHSSGREQVALRKQNQQLLKSEAPLKAQAKAFIASSTCTPIQPVQAEPLTAAIRAQDAREAASVANGTPYTAPQ